MRLAEKYRPRRFQEVIGQENAAKQLHASARSPSPCASVLIDGTWGAGKTSLALIYAASVNCTKRNIDGNPCWSCTTCKEVKIPAGRSHSTLGYLYLSGGAIKDVNEITSILQYVPQAKFRVLHIDEAHLLSENVQNRLLQVLEAFSRRTIIIFTTYQSNLLLEALKSRCVLKLSLRTPSLRETAELLSDILIREGFEELASDGNVIVKIAQSAPHGHIRDAINALENYIQFSNENLDLR